MIGLKAAAVAAAAAAALVASSCGGGEAAGAKGSAIQCEQATRNYLDALRALALKILYVEGAYVEYRVRVGTIRAERAEIDDAALSPACRRSVVAVADRARDEYAAALTAWDEWRVCERAGRGGCGRFALDRALQRHWRRADYTRQEAEENLSNLLGAEERGRGYAPPTDANAG